MLIRTVLVLVLALSWAVIYWKRGLLGIRNAIILSVLTVVAAGSAWLMIDRSDHREMNSESNPISENPAAVAQLPSDTCLECHQSRHASWQRSFHRTMTREATAEYVKADFNDAVYSYMGITSRMYREGDRFLIDTVDPGWAAQSALRNLPVDKEGSAPRRVFSVDRVVGSHWFQQMLYRDEQGRYIRLPLVYHLVEKRWIHANRAFLQPESPNFFGLSQVWNESCLFCHNTGPNKQLVPRIGLPPVYHSKVSELGISCEACHGPGEQHVLAHKGQGRAANGHRDGSGDETIVNPSRLSVKRSDDVCAHCHGAGPRPMLETWNPDTQADPFRPGKELRQTHFLSWSETELANKYNFTPDPVDGRFWGDGTPLTTALEYQGMALSKCYQGGEGKMSCLTCHDLHGDDPDHQLKPGMRSNEACYKCHENYRKNLIEHTHHAADSPGSNCYNCHMPYQVYSLLSTHRTHRISVPRMRDSIATGKPHACNLCHLDKSMGWTGEQIQKWYGTKPELLSDDDRALASSILHLMRGDARSRAVVAGSFSWPAAQQASGRDWPGPLLIRTLEKERYPAARYLAHRALKSLYGAAANEFDYLADPSQRAEQLRAMQMSLRSFPKPDKNHYPFLSLTSEGQVSNDLLNRLVRDRSDPDILIRE